jgi:hypothetical protein
MSESDLTVVSHEQDGRILSGVGVTADELAETMERHAPEPETPAAPPATTAAPVAPEPDKQTRGQKRFAELTREREDAKRLAAEAQAERDRYKAELEQFKARPPQAPPTAPKEAVAPPPKETRPKPKEDEIGTKYQTYGDYVEDLADWKAEQRLATVDFDARIRQSIEADRASRSVTDRVTAAADRGRQAYPDFDAVLKAPVATYPNALLARIATMDGAEHMYYQLATNREASQRILAALQDPLTLGLELAKLGPSAPGASPASPARTVAPPPPPYQPVVGGSKTTVTPSADLAKGFDFDKSGYRERRAAERGVSRR